jgi:hypothetical protein
MSFRKAPLCVAAVGALAVSVAGCSSLPGGSPAVVSYDRSGVVAEMASRLRPLDATADTWLYVAGQGDSVVDVYDVTQPGRPLVQTITQGVNYPVGLTVGPDGTLYVSNLRGGAGVSEYPPGQTAPSLVLDVSQPFGVVINRRGDTIVTTRDSPPCLLVFRPGKTKPHRKICNSLFSVPSQLVQARGGTLYISDNKTGVVMMKSLDAPVISLGLQDLPQCPTGIALDERAKELFVSGCLGGTQVYSLGSPSPVRSLDQSIDADNIAGGRIDHHYDVFTPSLHGTTVSVYRSRSTEPFETLHVGTVNTIGIALKPAGVP